MNDDIPASDVVPGMAVTTMAGYMYFVVAVTKTHNAFSNDMISVTYVCLSTQKDRAKFWIRTDSFTSTQAVFYNNGTTEFLL